LSYPLTAAVAEVGDEVQVSVWRFVEQEDVGGEGVEDFPGIAVFQVRGLKVIGDPGRLCPGAPKACDPEPFLGDTTQVKVSVTELGAGKVHVVIARNQIDLLFRKGFKEAIQSLVAIEEVLFRRAAECQILLGLSHERHIAGLAGGGSNLVEECFLRFVLPVRLNTKATAEGLFKLHEKVGLGVAVKRAVDQVSTEEIEIGAGRLQEHAKPPVIMMYVGCENQVHDEHMVQGIRCKVQGTRRKKIKKISTKIALPFFTGAKGDIGCDQRETKFMERKARHEEKDVPGPCTVDAILFDFGGVIADEGFRNGLAAIAEADGLPAEPFLSMAEALIYDVGYVLGRVDENAYWEALRKETGIHGTDRELREVILSHFTLRPWMLQLIRTLHERSIRLAILSDQTDWLDELNERHGFFKWFEQVFNSFHIGRSKREASLFDMVLREMTLSPDLTVFVDDNAGNIQRARARGLRTVLYRDRGQFTEEMGVFCPFLVQESHVF
jgi:HAD superfamily hydrolase (TIGR01509 family)